MNLSDVGKERGKDNTFSGKIFGIATGSIMLAMATGNANATLVGVVQTFPDTTLTAAGPYMVYDHDGVNSSTGLLQIISGSSTLTESPANGGDSFTQSYFGAGDSIPDIMLSIQIDNSTGAWTGGSVSIGFGNNTSNSRYSWLGDITDFGFQDNGSLFDAVWTVTSDQYQNLPATMSQFTDGYLSGSTGGIKISNSSGFGSIGTGAEAFASDWVFGTSVTTTPLLNSYLGDLDSPLKTNSTVTVDLFTTPVPLPAAVWLLGSGLLALGGFTIRKQSGQQQ